MIVTTPIKVDVSTHHIVFTPSDDGNMANAAPDLAVTVTNLSQVFASFQVALHVEGQNPNDTGEWYKVEPNVGAKKPPGDRTTFYISLTRAPIPAYGTTIPAKLTVFSAELSDLDVSQPIYIKLLRPSKTLRVYLPLQDLQVTPGNRLRIPALVYNLNPTPRNITVRLQGLELDWLPEAFEQSLWIEAGGSTEAEFWCAPAPVPSNLQQVRPFTIEATDSEGNSASIGSKLEILPFGYTKVTVGAAEQILPAKASNRSSQRQQTAHYPFQIHNCSNVSQTILLQPNDLNPTDRVTPNPVVVAAAAVVDHDFVIETRRPVVGWTRTRQIEVWPQLTYADSAEAVANVNVQPASQLLTLKLRPVVPWWVQLLLLLLGCLGLGWLWLLSPRPLHTEPVNSIALMSNGDTVASGSRDQTLRRWQVSHHGWLPNIRRLRFRTKIETQDHRFQSAIRVIEPLPANNKQIAVGLENGGIQLWNVDPPEFIPSFLDSRRLDKVFDLAFTQNSRYLFSGHGSGRVRQWDMTRQDERDDYLYLGAPVSSLDVIERSAGESWVAIATQFNRLVLWDWQQKRAYDIRYSWPEENEDAPVILPVTSSNSYLTGLDVADGGTRMVTADSVGFLTLWDVDALVQCTQTSVWRSPLADKLNTNGHELLVADCEDAKLHQWHQNPNGQAVRGVAITDNSCYVSSTGDNGHIDLWQIDHTNQPKRFNLARVPKRSLNTVDIHLTTNDGERPNRNDIVLVAADTANHRVQLYRKAFPPNRCQ